MTVGERIRQLRLKAEITQQELADYIGVSKQAVYKYENNIVTNIPTDKVNAIASYLKVSPAYLMGWEEQPELEKTQAETAAKMHAEKESLLSYVNALQSGKTPGWLNLQYFSGSFLQAVPEVQQALLETRCQKLGPYLLKVSDEGFAQVETYAKFIAEQPEYQTESARSCAESEAAYDALDTHKNPDAAEYWNVMTAQQALQQALQQQPSPTPADGENQTDPDK